MALRVPHTFALLFGLVAVAALATHWIPAGEFERVERGGRVVVEPGSYAAVDARPAGPAAVLLAFPRGLQETAHIVFYIFIIGGAFGVVNATGAVETSIRGVVRLCGGRGELVIAVLTVLFSLAGATIGMAEETLVFLPGLVVLARRLGYDEITGGAIALVGAGAGFSGAFLNPFTVGVAQDIAGLPLFSGLGYRLVVWLVLTAVTVVYIVRYARRQRREPAAAAAASAAADPAGDRPLAGRQVAVLALLALALAAVVAGALAWGWGILELSALFVAVAAAAGAAGGLGASGTAERFVEGAAAITGGALVVGLARGVLVIFEGARVTDTILAAMAGAIQDLPGWASVAGLYGVQVVLNYLVPSGSGQAALSIPILAPLADLVGVTRQTTVLAYQFGDGFSNVFTPTQGYFMAGLALLGVSWERWVRFMWRLECLWLAVGFALLLVAHGMRWGPF
ncbi:MAG: AbgT family transporter [Acidobacteriota bacterium]|nr:AbgT family transporter [Acidobacteriota bacterium]MDH3524296.1 AbgT family transporter [Acidobacteriota bacterium]